VGKRAPDPSRVTRWRADWKCGQGHCERSNAGQRWPHPRQTYCALWSPHTASSRRRYGRWESGWKMGTRIWYWRPQPRRPWPIGGPGRNPRTWFAYDFLPCGTGPCGIPTGIRLACDGVLRLRLLTPSPASARCADLAAALIECLFLFKRLVLVPFGIAAHFLRKFTHVCTSHYALGAGLVYFNVSCYGLDLCIWVPLLMLSRVP
jgi:hypothetical protein